MSGSASIQQLAINTIRTLSMDGVQAANSGHPGTPMALAPVAFQLWTENLRFDPKNPLWPNRDRFVLSCGHASMLIYSLIHLAGIREVDHAGVLHPDKMALTLENLKQFRQIGSPCAGHPEFGEAAGLKRRQGLLGKGCQFGRDGHRLQALRGQVQSAWTRSFRLQRLCLCGDGDLMEGVASEAASIAGHLQLSNLCWIYDDNGITIEGHTDLAFSEDVAKRFQGMGWNTVRVEDANDLVAMQKALDVFKSSTDKPTLILVRSVIGYGSPNKANSHGAHGAPLGDDEIKLTKQFYGWPENEKFLVPKEVPEYFASTMGVRGGSAQAAWTKRFEEYARTYSKEAGELRAIHAGELPSGWDAGLKPFEANAKGLATRVSSGKVLNMLALMFPR